jgi:hypothetical protein
MRFKSKVVDGLQVFAVTGVNTVSFGITATAAAKPKLLGFGVKRGRKGKQLTTMRGFKVFKSIISKPTSKTEVSTFDHPVQSFVWDDFTAQPDTVYDYEFHPFRGTPANLDRTAKPIPIRIRTEPLFSTEEHDVFFNRGVASSQAYARKFGNKRPDKQPTAKKREEALQWLTRDLDEAALAFIKQAKSGDMLLCCFYEFRYRPVADELKDAIGRGVDVRLIIDAKVNEYTDKDGKFHASFPREDNLQMITDAKIPMAKVTLREAKPNNIAHNKFMVLLTGAQRTPREVWTGSTNISLSGFSGQTNVGHWLRNASIAEKYRDYWDLLRGDPGPKAGDSPSDVRHANADFRADVEALFDVPTDIAGIPKGVIPVFSPRTGSEVLDQYVKMLDTADEFSCITLAFGINKAFKDELKDNTANSHLIFLLLEKPDAPTKKNKATFVTINASNNVYKASGAFIRDPVYQFVKESYPQSDGHCPARELRPFEVPAHGPVEQGPDRGHGLGQLQRRFDERQRREHADHSRRPTCRRHLLHGVQPAVQSLLLPLGLRGAEESQEGERRRERVSARNRRLAGQVQEGKTARQAREHLREDGGLHDALTTGSLATVANERSRPPHPALRRSTPRAASPKLSMRGSRRDTNVSPRRPSADRGGRRLCRR